MITWRLRSPLESQVSDWLITGQPSQESSHVNFSFKLMMKYEINSIIQKPDLHFKIFCLNRTITFILFMYSTQVTKKCIKWRVWIWNSTQCKAYRFRDNHMRAYQICIGSAKPFIITIVKLLEQCLKLKSVWEKKAEYLVWVKYNIGIIVNPNKLHYKMA